LPENREKQGTFRRERPPLYFMGYHHPPVEPPWPALSLADVDLDGAPRPPAMMSLRLVKGGRG
jgi:hypothetical protein